MHYTKMPHDDGIRLLQQLFPEVAKYDIALLHQAFQSRGQQFDFDDIPHWYDDNHSDQLIYEATIEKLKPFAGNLIVNSVYTDEHGYAPHEVPAEHLESYIAVHVKEFGTAFFNVDAIIFCPLQHRFFLVHHNGLFSDAWFSVAGPSSPNC